MSAEILDMGVVLIYFVGMIIVGFLASRGLSGAQDFAIASGKLKFPVLLGTLVATQIGGSATLGRAGKAYDVGIAIGFASIAFAIGLFAFTRLAPVLRRINVWTIPAALELRYGRTMRAGVAVVIMAAITALFSVQLIAFGLAVVAFFGGAGVTFTQAVLVASLIMIAYTVVGGFLAVAYTDMIQAGIMVIAIGIILPWLVMADMGGAAVALSHIQPDYGNLLGGMTIVFVLSFFVIDIPAVLIDVTLWQRNGAAQSDAHMRRALYWTIAIFIGWSVVAISLGVWASVLLPELATNGQGGDAAIPELVAVYMPPVIKGLCLAALMAVMMSTADTMLLLGGTTAGFDILKALKPGASERQIMLTTRTTIIVIGALGTAIALSKAGLFSVALLATAVYVSGVFAPTMAALFLKKATKPGAILSLVAATGTVLWLYAMRQSGTLPHWIEPIFASLLVGGIVMVLVSALTHRWSGSTVRLVDRMAVPATEEENS